MESTLNKEDINILPKVMDITKFCREDFLLFIESVETLQRIDKRKKERREQELKNKTIKMSASLIEDSGPSIHDIFENYDDDDDGGDGENYNEFDNNLRRLRRKTSKNEIYDNGRCYYENEIIKSRYYFSQPKTFRTKLLELIKKSKFGFKRASTTEIDRLTVKFDRLLGKTKKIGKPDELLLNSSNSKRILHSISEFPKGRRFYDQQLRRLSV